MPTRSGHCKASVGAEGGNLISTTRDAVIGFFEAFAAPLLAGRDFAPGDLEASASVVIVNRSFAREVMGDGNVLGRRVRVAPGVSSGSEGAEPVRWYEIVGVVDDVQYLNSDAPPARLYYPLTPGRLYPVSLMIHLRGATLGAAGARLRQITASIDPSIRLGRIHTLDESLKANQLIWRMGALAITIVTLSVLLLAAAGIYPLMSFTVTRRRREIGVRAALGADPGRLLASIFSRSASQLLVGVLAGLALSGLIFWVAGGELPVGETLLLGAAAGGFMTAVGLLASLGPARRGLSIQPTEALREL